METSETATALLEVAKQLGEVIPRLDTLNGKIANIEKHSKRNAALSVVVVFLIIVSLVGNALVGALLIQTHNVNDRIYSCTTPEGECYNDSNRRTSSAVQLLIDNQRRGELVVACLLLVPDGQRTEQVHLDCDKKASDQVKAEANARNTDGSGKGGG
jgi:hypothetical protein